jgi:CRISPR system Cascade subunit CasE
VTSTGKGNPRGPRRDLRSDEERLEWIKRKGELSGFQVSTCGITVFSFRAVKSSVGFRAKSGSFAAAQFDGELIVTDEVLFKKAIESGIGTQKAYGFGLLSVGRV